MCERGERSERGESKCEVEVEEWGGKIRWRK